MTCANGHSSCTNGNRVGDVRAKNVNLTREYARLAMCYRLFDMGSRLRRASLGAVVFVALLALGACESPTLPLPPPALPMVTTQGLPPGEVKLVGVRSVEPNAIVETYNPNPSLPLDERVGGAQADGQGTWDATIFASSGDVVEITEQTGAAVSPPTTVQIP